MALIVEDGTGKPDSEAYLSVDDAVAYHTALGNTAFLNLNDVLSKERALRKATKHMTQEYRQAWKGQRVSATQALDWPRVGVEVDDFCVPSDSVPQAVREACAELALRVLTGQLSPDEGPQKSEVKVGPITVKYAEGTRTAKKFTAVDATVAPYLKGGGSSNSIPVYRA
jgi:hypothetical protein